MKRASLVLISLLFAAATVAAGPQNPDNPCSKKAKNPCNPCSAKSGKVKGGERTIVGYIGDSKCGLNHPMGMGDAKTCTLKCVDMGSKFILADRAHNVVYVLDEDAQSKVREFAGQQVKISGKVDAATKTIHLEKISKA